MPKAILWALLLGAVFGMLVAGLIALFPDTRASSHECVDTWYHTCDPEGDIWIDVPWSTPTAAPQVAAQTRSGASSSWSNRMRNWRRDNPTPTPTPCPEADHEP